MDEAEKIAAAFRARQLEAEVTVVGCFWGEHTRLPTVLLGRYLGHGQVTVRGGTCRWLTYSGQFRYMATNRPDLVVDRVIKDRAGLGVVG